jgi:hypothetical protein
MFRPFSAPRAAVFDKSEVCKISVTPLPAFPALLFRRDPCTDRAIFLGTILGSASAGSRNRGVTRAGVHQRRIYENQADFGCNISGRGGVPLNAAGLIERFRDSVNTGRSQWQRNEGYAVYELSGVVSNAADKALKAAGGDVEKVLMLDSSCSPPTLAPLL